MKILSKKKKKETKRDKEGGKEMKEMEKKIGKDVVKVMREEWGDEEREEKGWR